MIEPFTTTVPEAELEVLRMRLRATRWPEAETDPSQGVALGELQDLCAYWCGGYDWRRGEARLNRSANFGPPSTAWASTFARPLATPDALPADPHSWLARSVIEFLEALSR